MAIPTGDGRERVSHIARMYTPSLLLLPFFFFLSIFCFIFFLTSSEIVLVSLSLNVVYKYIFSRPAAAAGGDSFVFPTSPY